jgi:hypothetical protein
MYQFFMPCWIRSVFIWLLALFLLQTSPQSNSQQPLDCYLPEEAGNFSCDLSVSSEFFILSFVDFVVVTAMLFSMVGLGVL